MKIISWNVNGIRSLEKSMKFILVEFSADVVCFQETKVSRGQLPETTALVNEFTSYFSYPRKQNGYSGVATYCRDNIEPKDVEEGLPSILELGDNHLPEDSVFSALNLLFDDMPQFDSEGRVLISYHLVKYEEEIQQVAIINIYCPRVDPEKPERHMYKMQFCYLLESKVRQLCQQGCSVIILGDWNIAYSVIDHCDPGDENEFNSSEARQWMTSFLSSQISFGEGTVHIIDAFRYIYPDRRGAYTCWNTKTNARLTNYGTRIDYILITSNLIHLLENSEILTDHYGSDHCPVGLTLKCDCIPHKHVKRISVCTRFWPEFSGRQQSLLSFLQKGQKEISQSSKPKKQKIQQKAITNFFQAKAGRTDNLVSVASATVILNQLGTDRLGEVVNKRVKNENGSKKHSYSSNLKNDEKEHLHSSNRKNGGKERSNSSDRDNSKIAQLEQDDFSDGPAKTDQSSAWKVLLTGPPKPPFCKGHNKECVIRSVRKKGPNCGRQFFMCPQPAGHASNPEANCNFFMWAFSAKVDKTDNALKPGLHIGGSTQTE